MAEEDDVMVPPSWLAVDLWGSLSLDQFAAVPTVGDRDDDTGLIYPGKTNMVASAPEGGKSWFALKIAVDELHEGARVIYIDYEDDAHGIAMRLRQLGVTEAEMGRMIYIRPEVPLGDNQYILDQVAELRPSLVVIDGVTEAMTLQGLSINDNADSATFFRVMPTAIANLGPAVLLLDHEVKKEQDRGAYSIGAGHKLAAISGVSYKLRNTEPFAPGHVGKSALIVAKDRPGQIRRRAVDKSYGELVVDSQGSDFVKVTVRAQPGVKAKSDRIERLKSRIVEAMGDSEYPTKSAIKALVSGGATAIQEALTELIDEGVVTAARPYKTASVLDG